MYGPGYSDEPTLEDLAFCFLAFCAPQRWQYWEVFGRRQVSFLPNAFVPVYSQCGKHLIVILASLNRKKCSSLGFWYISNIFYYFSFCLRKNMKPACNANGFWHVHSIGHSSTMRHILKGQCVEGAFLRVYLQRKGHVVISAFKRGLHCLILKNYMGNHRWNAYVLPVLLQGGKETCFEGSPSWIECVCSWALCVSGYIFKFSRQVLLTVLGTSCASRAFNTEAVNLSQGEKTQPIP